MSEVKSQGKLSVVSLILLVLLLGSAAGNVFQYFNTQQVIVEKEKTILQIDSIATMKAKLDIAYESAVEELDQYKGRSAELDSLLAEANGKLEEQKKRIAYLIDQNEGYDILRQRYAELDELKNQYLQRIDELVAMNAELRSQVTSLQVAVDNTNEEKKVLQGKVDVAARLKLSSITLKAYNLKSSGKAVDTDKANKTDRVSISYVIDDNPLASSGARAVYVRLIDPDGRVVADQSGSVRKFTTDKGTEMYYSRTMQVDFNGSRLNQSLNWDKIGFRAGTYEIEIYIDNYYAGKSSIQLK